MEGLFRLKGPPKRHDIRSGNQTSLEGSSFLTITQTILELSLKWFTRSFSPTLCSTTWGKSSFYSWKKKQQQQNGNETTNQNQHTIKRPHLDQVMHLSFYRERYHDLTGSFKAFDPPFHIFQNLKTLKMEKRQLAPSDILLSPARPLKITLHLLLRKSVLQHS